MIDIDKKEIDKCVYDILKRSKSFDILPTPVDSIVKFCELNLDLTTGIHSIPSHFIAKKVDLLQKLLRKVRGVLDFKERIIYIDPEQSPLKQNFIKLHEVGHDALKWQNATLAFLDDDKTLDPNTKEQFEAEANYFASGALFQLERYDEELLKLPLEIGSPMALAKMFGSSNHASIRRYTERSKKRCALLILNKPDTSTSNFELGLRNYFDSPSFNSAFGDINWTDKIGMGFPFVQDFYRKRRFHKEGEISLSTKNGDENFEYHFFNNHYNIFVLIIPKGEKIKSRTKIYLASSPNKQPLI